jgi:hypothetical protein
MKHVLQLWVDEVITIQAVEEARARGTGYAIKLKAKENKATGRKTTSYTAFSGTNWKDDTNFFLQSIIKVLSDDKMKEITDLAQTAARKATKAGEKSLASSNEEEDGGVLICSGSESSEAEDEEDCGPGWKNQGKFSPPLPYLMVSNKSVSELPNLRHQTPTLTRK